MMNIINGEMTVINKIITKQTNDIILTNKLKFL